MNLTLGTNIKSVDFKNELMSSKWMVGMKSFLRAQITFLILKSLPLLVFSLCSFRLFSAPYTLFYDIFRSVAFIYRLNWGNPLHASWVIPSPLTIKLDQWPHLPPLSTPFLSQPSLLNPTLTTSPMSKTVNLIIYSWMLVEF